MAYSRSAAERLNVEFQSLKGFQRFCGIFDRFAASLCSVSIPKRVSEVLWPR